MHHGMTFYVVTPMKKHGMTKKKKEWNDKTWLNRHEMT